MALTETVEATDVQAGDFIPALDNAYVFDVEDDPDIRTPENTQMAGDEYTCLTFHDKHGDEGYLIVPKDMLITIKARG